MALFSKLNKSSLGMSTNLLTNKWALYIILILGIFDIFNFYQNGQMMSLYVFLFVGILTSFFSKNMIVVIVTSIAISHIFTYGEKMTEGFDAEEEEEEDKEGLEGDMEAEVEAEADADADAMADDADAEAMGADAAAEAKKKASAVTVPSGEAIKGAAADLAGEIKKSGVDGLSKETFALIKAQETLLDNLGKLSNFVKVEGMAKKEGYCNLADAYKTM
jgi:hypothetical protein